MVDPAELFEAISHPERIKILKILSKQPSSFASLKRQLGIESSGNLDYHLKKLSQLVTVRKDGLYGLTDGGKEALLSIEAIEMWAKMEKRKIKMPTPAVIGGFLCMFSGILLILLENVFPQATSNSSTLIFDYSLTIVCGLLMLIGGVLILLRRNILGAVMSIIFGLFPPPPSSIISDSPGAYHAFNIIFSKLNPLDHRLALLIAAVVGSLPIIGGMMGLITAWKIRIDLLYRLRKIFVTRAP